MVDEGSDQRNHAVYLHITEQVYSAYRAAASTQYVKTPTFMAWWLRETLPQLQNKFPVARQVLLHGAVAHEEGETRAEFDERIRLKALGIPHEQAKELAKLRDREGYAVAVDRLLQELGLPRLERPKKAGS